jgi:hypothetical protein
MFIYSIYLSSLGDNVRGKTKFSASKEQLCKDLDLLVSSCGIENRVVLMYDHGNEHEAHLYGSLAVCFSGSLIYQIIAIIVSCNRHTFMLILCCCYSVIVI